MRRGSARSSTSLRAEPILFERRFSSFASTIQMSAPWGAGRIAAFGLILNRIGEELFRTSTNVTAPDAPVEYPHLWGSHYDDLAQWTASVRNVTYLEQLGRNVGQALGSFVEVGGSSGAAVRGITSSVNIENLARLEELLARLKPPAWPGPVFGEVDAALTARGRVL